MTYRLGTLGLIAAMVLSLPSHAQDEEPADEAQSTSEGAKAKLGRSLYFSALGNYFRAAKGRGTDDGFGGQISLGKSVTNGLNLELVSQYLTADPETGSGSTKLTGVGIGAMVFPSSTLPDLYVPLTLMRGQVRDNPGVIPDYSTTFFDIGLGYLIGLGSVGEFLGGTSIRAEVKYRIDAHGREQAGVGAGERKAFYEGIAGLGVLIPLGVAPPVVAPPAEEAPAEIVPVEAGDSDNDGVPDDRDQCPDTPAGTAVDENGCPAEPAPEPAPAPDCVPPGPGEPIDLNGCKAGASFVLRGVTFELDSARLTPNAKVILDGVADALLAQQGITAEIGGYTSSEGSEGYNQKLSERRAASVTEYLVGRGVAADRLTPKGYGEASPVADNNTAEGRELNRRVELKVVDSGTAAAPASDTASEAPAEATEAPADAAPAEEAPAEEAPAEASSEAPVEAAAEGEATEAPAAEEPAAEPTEEPTPVEGEPAPEVENAQPAQ